ncbi:LysR family transcriptional regulator [Noviherbaspirillum cavernae]|uniref:LysR family transcriptional regulator n=1 Tax=Noviherbaspirillum cavernae TaxID=2320862 RepID=A0A418WUU7_9BURK|nr:LysR family transcriptional regulator [Noviherbaspirillum cavernae]RJF96475.1 LysR family transcriptional regulator [Noviherbaspirillum cavernae]
MTRFDLNLLPVALAIYEEKSVSGAGKRLGMSQPATSAALNRLRQAFGDQLFVRTANGMEPTPRAMTLINPAREILARVEDDVLQGEAFDPATTKAVFSFALSDIGEMVFLPKLLERIQREAPHATVASVTLPVQEIAAAIEAGRVDLAIGYFPDFQKNNFFQQRLFSHAFTCLLRRNHKIRGNQLTMQQFLNLGHAVIRAEGRSQEVFERYLEKKKIERRVVLSTPHFMSIPFIIGTSDLVATVPYAVGISFAEFAGIKLVKPPLEIPRFDLKQHWHRKYHEDAKNRWLRSIVADLFHNDARWPGKAA